MENSEKDGQDIYTYSNGSKYEGGWIGAKMHGQGTLISPSGEITATGEYCDGRLEKLQSVTITKGDKRHFFEYKDGKLFYTSPGSTESIEIDLKINKRILPVLEQFANFSINKINVAKRLLRYYFGNEGVIRINSSKGGEFGELEEHDLNGVDSFQVAPKIDSCSQLADELPQHIRS